MWRLCLAKWPLVGSSFVCETLGSSKEFKSTCERRQCNGFRVVERDNGLRHSHADEQLRHISFLEIGRRWTEHTSTTVEKHCLLPGLLDVSTKGFEKPYAQVPMSGWLCHCYVDPENLLSWQCCLVPDSRSALQNGVPQPVLTPPTWSSRRDIARSSSLPGKFLRLPLKWGPHPSFNVLILIGLESHIWRAQETPAQQQLARFPQVLFLHLFTLSRKHVCECEGFVTGDGTDGHLIRRTKAFTFTFSFSFKAFSFARSFAAVVMVLFPFSFCFRWESLPPPLWPIPLSCLCLLQPLLSPSHVTLSTSIAPKMSTLASRPRTIMLDHFVVLG